MTVDHVIGDVHFDRPRTTHVLPSVGVVRVRALQPGEHEPVLSVFHGMSARSRFLRFHAPTPRLSAGMLRQLADVEAGSHEAVVASVAGRPVGIARWVRDRTVPARAELAVEIVDAYQGLGLGHLLTVECARGAESAGVAELVCHLHAENASARAMLICAGASARHGSGVLVVSTSRLASRMESQPLRVASSDRIRAVDRWLHEPVQIQVLGPVRLLRGEEELAVRGQRALDLLAALVLRRQHSVSTDVLLDVVWGDEAQDLDGSVVHTVVARLRRALGTDTIVSRDAGYRLSRQVSVDDDDFVDALDAARTADRVETVGLLRSALDLWRTGVAYDGVSDEIVLATRVRLDERRRAAREQLAAALLATGNRTDVAEALDLSAALVDEHPLRERGYELRMLAAYAGGDQPDALAAFGRARSLLRSELGIDPGPDLTRLHARILGQDPSLLVSREPPLSPRRTAARPPAAALPLVAREGEVGQILGLVEDHRLVTLVGTGGVGKSRLLTEVGQRLGVTRDVRYLGLGGAGAIDQDELDELAAQALGVSVSSVPVRSMLVDALADAEVVLLVDEAEWALDSVAGLLSEVAQSCPGVTCVVTSRSALGVVGEALVEVRPLACPQQGEDEEAIQSSPAVRLLLARIADHAPTWTLDERDLPLVADLVRRVDGLPLALELLASHAGSRSLSDLSQLLDSPLELGASERDRPPRHRTLRDTIGWSVDRLPDETAMTFRRLGVFAGAFDLSAARAVVGVGADYVERDLQRLVADALLTLERGSSGVRVRMLRTVRDLAVEQMIEHGELVATRSRHRAWLAARWRGAPRRDDLLEDVQSRRDDYVEALRSALEDKDSSTVGDLLLTFDRVWLFTDSVGVGLRWIGRVLDSGLVDEHDRARILVHRASLALHHEPDSVRADLAAALPVLAAEEDHAWLATAYKAQALERMESGQLTEALEPARQAVVAGREVPAISLGDALGVLALVAATAGERDEAVSAADEAWRIVRESGSVVGVASVASNLSLALLELDQAEEALGLLDLAASEVRSLGEMHDPLFLTLNTGWAALGCDQADRALACFAAVVDLIRDAPADRRAAEVYTGAGCALARLEHSDSADVLDGAEQLRHLVGLVLSPWQAAQVDRARDQRAARAPVLPPSPTALARQLSTLVVGAVKPAAGQ